MGCLTKFHDIPTTLFISQMDIIDSFSSKITNDQTVCYFGSRQIKPQSRLSFKAIRNHNAMVIAQHGVFKRCIIIVHKFKVFQGIYAAQKIH